MGEGDRKTETERSVMNLQAKGSQQASEARRELWNRAALTDSRRNPSC